jgi:Spy/CpxP family protein refolding chaperone
MRVLRSVLPLLLLLTTVAVAPLEGQRTPRSSEDRARLEERMRARVGEIIRHRLGLDREEEARLSAIAQEFEQRRRALVASERETRQQIEPFLESGRADDAEAAAIIERMIAFKRQEAELFREEQVRLQEVLTPTQVLQLYDLRMELGRRIRALRGGGGDGGRGGPGGEANRRGTGGGEPGVRGNGGHGTGEGGSRLER